MKLTGWYHGDQSPVRVGPFKRKAPWGRVYFSYWNGTRFSVFCDDAEQSYRYQFVISDYQNLPWRGVAK